MPPAWILLLVATAQAKSLGKRNLNLGALQSLLAQPQGQNQGMNGQMGMNMLPQGMGQGMGGYSQGNGMGNTQGMSQGMGMGQGSMGNSQGMNQGMAPNMNQGMGQQNGMANTQGMNGMGQGMGSNMGMAQGNQMGQAMNQAPQMQTSPMDLIASLLKTPQNQGNQQNFRYDTPMNNQGMGGGDELSRLLGRFSDQSEPMGRPLNDQRIVQRMGGASAMGQQGAGMGYGQQSNPLEQMAQILGQQPQGSISNAPHQPFSFPQGQGMNNGQMNQGMGQNMPNSQGMGQNNMAQGMGQSMGQNMGQNNMGQGQGMANQGMGQGDLSQLLSQVLGQPFQNQQPSQAQNYGGQPQNFGGQPQNQNFGGQGQNFGGQPQNQNFGGQPQNQNFGAKPQNFGGQQNYAAKPFQQYQDFQPTYAKPYNPSPQQPLQQPGSGQSNQALIQQLVHLLTNGKAKSALVQRRQLAMRR